MKNNKLITLYVAIILILGTIHCSNAQESGWNVHDEHEMTLNYNTLTREFAQGALYGTAGYGLGMWLSDNKPFWGHVGAVVVTNLPLIFEKRLDNPEAVIGRNVGALIPTVALTFTIELSNKGNFNFNLPHWVRK